MNKIRLSENLDHLIYAFTLPLKPVMYCSLISFIITIDFATISYQQISDETSLVSPDLS